jgi:Flp pilus assembly protein TadG
MNVRSGPVEVLERRRPHRARGFRRDDERGSVLVEFALVIPIFALMLFGMVQFGLAFAGWSSLRNSVQNGARLAAIGDVGAYSGQAASPPPCQGLAQAETDTGQFPGNDLTAEMYCEIVSQIGSPVGTSASSTNFPQVGLLVTNSIVTVCGLVQAQALTGLLPNMNLTSTSEFLIEDTVSLQTYNPYGISSCQ